MRHATWFGLACTVAAVATIASCVPPDGGVSEVESTSCSGPVVGVRALPFFPNLSFNVPTAYVRTPDGTQGIVTEKGGVIRAFPNVQTAQPSDVHVLVDLTPRVNSSAREPGINGIAFHPSWPKVAEAYVTYDGFPPGQSGPSAGWEWRLSRFVSRDGGKTLDPASEVILVRAVKIASEHNGGQMLFHPTEKGRTGVPLLYVSVGDGENPGGPAGNANNLSSIFGKFLRIDILDEATRAAAKPRIEIDAPSDNPFASKGTKPGAGLPTIYSWGHRNPWRWTFDTDPATGKTSLWLGEVGQDAFDEVNLVTKGGNYGWNVREARHGGFCGGSEQCDPTKLLGSCDASTGQPCVGGHLSDPILELPHQANPNDPTTKNAGAYVLSSVTGGFVYRGTDPGLSTLVGKYVYSDFETGNIFVFDPKKPTDAPINIGTSDQQTSWSTDADGSLIAIGFHGKLSKLVAGGCPIPFNPNGQHYAFLMKTGIGTEFLAWNYYKGANPEIPAVQAVVNNPPPSTFKPVNPDGSVNFLVPLPNYTLQDWKNQFLANGATVSALYRNNLDLGFWRQMTCTTTIAPGKGGCSVTNWPATDAKGNPIEPSTAQLADPSQTNLGTVTMNISAQGVTRFYVFAGAAPHKLQPFAILDAEGVKFIPQLCTTCHAGNSTGAADLGSVFREFEPEALVKRSAITQAQAQTEWFQLNQAISTANASLQGFAASNLASGASAQKAILDYVQSMYPTMAPPALSIKDPSRIPASYLTDATASPDGQAKQNAKKALWSNTIGHYCMGCHRLNNVDLSNYAVLDPLATSTGVESLFQEYIMPRQDDPLRQKLVIMPQAAYQSQLLVGGPNNAPPADGAALDAVDNWIGAVNSSVDTPMCNLTFVISTDIGAPSFDPNTQALRVIGTTAPLPPGLADPISNFDPAKPGLNMQPDLTPATPFKMWRANGNFPQGAKLQYQACVGKNEAVSYEFRFGQPNRALTVPTTPGHACSEVITFAWGSAAGSEGVANTSQ